MTLRFLFVGLFTLLLASPAAAQSTCSDCVGGGSDIAGALFQGSANAWATPEARAQLNERATALNTLSSDATAPSIAPAVADAFAAAPNARALLMQTHALPELKADLHSEWTTRGLPAAEAEALIDALSGLTAKNRVEPEALQTSLDAYNAAVAAAAPTFVTDPAPSFLALRHALAALTQAAP
ncbi:hypothetical protein CRI93_12720 [Longimonas halophila]|uniref:Uncharacterized protein n=1 Tax=Longimonas halophila TaxID=1469170 RepID=A0A2H3NLW2_9BACT|nr:hypothetical protein [Longimonas halophila]PEN05552.1 hypothetical protein CRI93_12720 [Longimonas halophila]